MHDLLPQLQESRSSETRDQELLVAVCAGQTAGLDALIGRYWSALVRYAERILGGPDAAEDVVQETFVRLWERREEWRRQGSVRALLYQITRNLALDERKRRERRTLFLKRYRSSAVALTPLDDMQERELEAAYRAAIQALPERRREVFLLARVDGLSYLQIAEVLGIAPQTVANHLSAALVSLRDRLREYLPSPDPPPTYPPVGPS